MKSEVRTLALIFVLTAGLYGTALLASATPLDDYVAAPDPAYTYGPTPANVIVGAGYTANVWYMASGTWRDPSEVDRTLWEHWVTVIIPDTVSYTKALMIVSGGSNKPTPPSSVDGTVAQIAVATQSIIANVAQIPNEKLAFSDETDPRYIPDGRNEDEIIAYTWDKFKTTGDATWLLRLPMTRAVVRAMDTVQAEHPTIDSFLVLGASKRGQTTWTTALVDPRVEAIVPMVIDYLNAQHSMQHHWDAYGYWADAIQEYVDMGIMDWMDTPTFHALCDVVDPYEYTDRLTMPKYVMCSTGDQFFLPDSSQFYWDALPDEKHLRYVPNTDHGIDSDTGTIEDLVAYYESYLNGTPRPDFSWTKQPDGSLHVQTVTPPTAVRLWQATNPTARNFRLDTIGAAWTNTDLVDQGGGVYIGQVAPPPEGWTAFLVELEFPSGGLYPFRFTTEVSVVPDTLPFREVGGWGTIETAGEGTDEIALVRLGGTRYEMGYWYGRLLADQVAAMWTIVQGLGVPQSEFDDAIDAMWHSAYFDTTEWENELRGVADGCADAGHAEVTYRVMQKMQMLPDMSELGCGLYALWGNATATGDLYQLRNLDWTMDAGFQDHPLVAIYNPEHGYRHATIGFAGSIGAGGGGMNEFGLAVSEIMGHFCDAETLDGIPFPILLRDVLQHDSTLSEALTRMDDATRTNQYHYCVGDPAAADPKARLLFTSHTRFDQYGDESVVDHPCVSPDPFHTSLDDVIYWKNHNGSGNENLYNAILARYGSIGDAEAIEIAQADGVSGTLQSIVYNNSQRKFWVAYAHNMDPAHNQGYVEFSLGEEEGIGGGGYRTSVGSGADEVPVVVVSGTPYEMGYHYGQLMQTEIQAFVPQFYEHVQDEDPAMFSDAELDAAWEATAPHTDDRYEQELLGLAAGAEIDYVMLRRTHCAIIVAPYSCSSVAAWDTATVDGHLYQTRDLDWDMDAHAHDHPAIVVYMPDAGHAHVNVAFAGTACSHTGMNAAGIALAEMGDSPGGEHPYDLDGVHFSTLFRHIMYDADSLTEALDILTNAPRIKRYHYVFGDGLNELAGVKIKAHAPDPPPNDLLIWTDNDPTDEFAPDVLVDVVYNDEGRGAFPTLEAQHGTLDADKMIALANQIATHGSNVMDVVYDATDLELWAAFAEGTVEAYLQPYVHLAPFSLDGDGDGIGDFEEGSEDPDGDGTPNFVDPDSDGDGIEDLYEGTDDPDEDGTPNYLDLDSDGDGIDDEVEGTGDPDLDEEPNYLDLDSDGDEMPDEYEDEYGLDPYVDDAGGDLDGDGVSNYQEYQDGTEPNNAASHLSAAHAWALTTLALGFGAIGWRALRRGAGEPRP